MRGRSDRAGALTPFVTASALAVLVLGSALVAAGAAERPSFLAPYQGERPFSISGPLAGLDVRLSLGAFLVVVLIMFVSYFSLLRRAESIPRRWLLAALIVVHVVFLLAPPVLSSDVFAYVGWARLGVLHGLNPYVHGPLAAVGDPVNQYLASGRTRATLYGPLFTLGTYAVVPLGVSGAVWALKLAAAAASLGCVALVARCAKQLGRSPIAAAAFVGLNPAWLVWALGGAHNDLFMLLLVLLGISLFIERREAPAGAALAAASIGIKAPAGLIAPFMLVASRRPRDALAGLLLGALVVAAIVLPVFHSDVFSAFTLHSAQPGVHPWSIPGVVRRVLGLGTIPGSLRLLAGAGVILFLLVQVRRGMDWIAVAGWATLTLLVVSTWLPGWYLAWPLPLAALSPDRRLRFAALGLQVFWVVAWGQVCAGMPWLSQPSSC
jgi:hypothetical protein